ncbi:MAG: hypothetical protein WD396_10485 [Pseudohongiellaceae bacterium]
MKFRIEKAVLIKLLIIGVLLFTVPFAVPFAFEFVLMADLMGLEALVLFLVYQSRQVISALGARVMEWRDHIAATIVLLASLYMFQPRVVLTHAAGSSLVMLLACSALMALALWVPAIYLSVGGFT